MFGLIFNLIDAGFRYTFYIAVLGIGVGAYLHHTKPNSTTDNIGSTDYVIFKIGRNIKGVEQIGILGNWYNIPK
jgi:hypothetical protein